MDEPDQKIIDVFICKLRKKLMQASSLLPPRAVLMGVARRATAKDGKVPFDGTRGWCPRHGRQINPR
jgi:hypothetical protein